MEELKKPRGNIIVKKQPQIKKENKNIGGGEKRPIAKEVEKDQCDITMLRDVLGHMIASYVDATQVIDKIRIARSIKSFESSMLLALGLRDIEMNNKLENLTSQVESSLKIYRLDNQDWKKSEEKVNFVFDKLLDIAMEENLVSISRDMFSVTAARSDIGRNQGMLPMANPESE